MISKKIWSSKKSFPGNMRALANRLHPIVLLRKRQKVPKFYLLVFRRKLEKHDYQSQNVKMENFPKKNVPIGISTKIFKHSPII